MIFKFKVVIYSFELFYQFQVQKKLKATVVICKYLGWKVGLTKKYFNTMFKNQKYFNYNFSLNSQSKYNILNTI